MSVYLSGFFGATSVRWICDGKVNDKFLDIIGRWTHNVTISCIFEPTCAHHAPCTVGSYASLSVCLSVCLYQKFIAQNVL